MSEPEVLWTPSEERVKRATLTRYQAWVEERHGLSFGSYEELWRWSVDNLEDFWASIVEFFDVRLGGEPRRGARLARDARGRSGSRAPRSTSPSTSSAARTTTRWRCSTPPSCDRWRRGTGAELRAETGQIAAGLRALGVGEGDRVAAYMPNIPETVAALLACASIGAIWSSAAPEFGARSVIDRFAQIEPKVLLAIDGYRYGGRDFDRRAVVDDIAGAIPSLERVVRLGYLDGSGWEDGFLVDANLTFAPVPFDHPLWVLYSSGTTGLPKPIVHSQGGILIEQVKKQHLHIDAQAGDRLFWFSTTGWMMWNFVVGMLLTDASIVLFDGNPGLSGPRHAVGFGGGHGDDDVRHQRRVHLRVHEGGRSAC